MKDLESYVVNYGGFNNEITIFWTMEEFNGYILASEYIIYKPSLFEGLYLNIYFERSYNKQTAREEINSELYIVSERLFEVILNYFSDIIIKKDK